jgi:asparagine synthase (glutamine-hydrolysing)
MGAFAAVLNDDHAADPAVVERMLAAAPHRGSRVDRLSTGRCSLAIANAPEVPPDASLAESDGLAAAFSGRLDNLEDMAKRFLELDSVQAGSTPAELILAIFRALGDGTPSVLRGVFGGAITDGTRLWAFRDHMAFGGLYYRQEPHRIFVASEAKQVVAGSGINAEPDLDAVERYFYADVDDATPCALKGVNRLPKATILHSDGRTARSRRYWDPLSLVETGRYTDEEIVERFHELMTQAVGRVLTGNDCVSLSGGVDSPAVASFGAEAHLAMSGRRLGAISMVFPSYPAVDESTFIQKVVERYPIDLHAYEPSARPLDDIERWVRLCDGPVPVHPPAEAAEHYTMAHSLGYTTMMGGDLAEFVIDRRYSLLSYLLAHGRWAAVPGVIASQRDMGVGWPAIARQFAHPFVPRSLMVARERRTFSGPEGGFPDWLDERRVNEVNARFVLAPRTRWRTEQIAFFVGPAIGTEADEIIQAVCGVRNRRPWIDIDLTEFFLSLRAEVKFPDARMKTLVKRLLRGVVPDEILDRSKKTFFNDRILGTIDWDALRRWLVEPSYPIHGVDYRALAQRIEAKDFAIGDHKWAVDLAKTHAFLAQW